MLYKYYQHKDTGLFMRLELDPPMEKEYLKGKFYLVYELVNGKWEKSHYIPKGSAFENMIKYYNEVDISK